MNSPKSKSAEGSSPPKDAPQYPPLHEVEATHVNTEQAAYYLCREVQTLRGWSCTQRGPIKPVKFFGTSNRLLWPVAEIRALLQCDDVNPAPQPAAPKSVEPELSSKCDALQEQIRSLRIDVRASNKLLEEKEVECRTLRAQLDALQKVQNDALSAEKEMKRILHEAGLSDAYKHLRALESVLLGASNAHRESRERLAKVQDMLNSR